MEVLKQPQYSPISMARQVAILFIAVNGHILDIKKEKVGVFIQGILEYLERQHTALLKTITETGVLNEDNESELVNAVEDFKRANQY
jgi:F-type H+-transporting ATPase subunit alpha